MKIDKDINPDIENKKTGFFHDRPKVNFCSNTIPTMRSIIIFAAEEEIGTTECDTPNQFSI